MSLPRKFGKAMQSALRALWTIALIVSRGICGQGTVVPSAKHFPMGYIAFLRITPPPCFNGPTLTGISQAACFLPSSCSPVWDATALSAQCRCTKTCSPGSPAIYEVTSSRTKAGEVRTQYRRSLRTVSCILESSLAEDFIQHRSHPSVFNPISTVLAISYQSSSCLTPSIKSMSRSTTSTRPPDNDPERAPCRRNAINVPRHGHHSSCMPVSTWCTSLNAAWYCSSVMDPGSSISAHARSDSKTSVHNTLCSRLHRSCPFRMGHPRYLSSVLAAVTFRNRSQS
mmetsp:Transcript_52986/g.119143  ORF Transcript_52986/g.119143 Transcript_52986/m.119143 type:complete len:284 (+) Transcript_52986:85-936(+)